MKAKVENNALIFEGNLDEMTSASHLAEAFEALKKQGAKPPITLDLSGVARGNSAGILTWLRFLKQVGMPAKYVNAPIWLVNQFNMISGYFENSSYVESFQAPMFDPQEQTSKIVTFKVGKDIPVLESYSEYQIPNQVIDGKEYETDFFPEQYFSFIAENINNYKTSNK